MREEAERVGSGRGASSGSAWSAAKRPGKHGLAREASHVIVALNRRTSQGLAFFINLKRGRQLAATEGRWE